MSVSNGLRFFSGLNRKLSFLIIFILINVLVFSGASCFRRIASKPIKIVVWNFWESGDGWDNMINSYEGLTMADETKVPVEIIYIQKSFVSNEQYEDELKEALRAGNGPDIITLNNYWMPRYKNKIIPLDEGAKTAQSFRRKFVDVVSYDFLEGNKIYAVPLSLDTLALYYNVDLLNAAGIFDPPRTWDEFNEVVKKLTVRDDRGNIKRAGAAIGTYKNIDRASDIFSLLMLQSGSTIVDDGQKIATFTDLVPGSDTEAGVRTTVGGVALQFYTDYANPDKIVYTWNPLMNYSIDAFSQEDAAMMIDYASSISSVRSKSRSLRFAVSSMPQILGVAIPVNYANYWGMTVSAGSTHPTEAWDFLMYITNPEINKMYLTANAKPTAQRDLIAWQENGEDLNLAVFARQSLTAKSWYQKDNFAVETIFNDAINSVVLGRLTPESASNLAASQLTQIMKK